MSLLFPNPPFSSNFLPPTTDYRGLYVGGFRWLCPYYTFDNLGDNEMPYTTLSTSSSYSTVVSTVKSAQNALLAWASNSKIGNNFNTLTLYTGGLLDYASTNTTTKASLKLTPTASSPTTYYSDSFQVRVDIAEFNSLAKKSYGITCITMDESNEMYFVADKYINQQYTAADRRKFFALRNAYNPDDVKLGRNKSIGGTTVSFFNAFAPYSSVVGAGAIAAQRRKESFDAIQLEQDWWRFDGSCDAPQVGYFDSKPWNFYDANLGLLYTTNSYSQQLADMNNFVGNSQSFVNGWTGAKASYGSGYLTIESYFARPDDPGSSGSPKVGGLAQAEINDLVQGTTRILLAEVIANKSGKTPKPDYTYFNTFNQLYYLAQAAINAKKKVNVIVLLYCTYDPNAPAGSKYSDYFDYFNKKITLASGGNHTFEQAYNEVLNQYYADIASKAGVSTDIQDNIQFIGYQVFDYFGGQSARY